MDTSYAICQDAARLCSRRGRHLRPRPQSRSGTGPVRQHLVCRNVYTAADQDTLDAARLTRTAPKTDCYETKDHQAFASRRRDESQQARTLLWTSTLLAVRTAQER